MNETNTHFDEALQLTYAMRAAAQSGDWVEVTDLEEKRRPLLQREVPHEVTIAQLVRQILAIDTEISTLALAARNTVAQEWGHARHVREVVKAYGEVKRNKGE